MSNVSPHTTVLLASYNGAQYIKEQLRSILEQQNAKFDVIVSDDNSTDNTKAIVNEFVDQKEPVRFYTNQSGSHGHKSNFNAACCKGIETQSQYFCFSDQDDVWHVDKLNKMTQRMVELEQKYGANTPILIHSDLRVVDESLREIAPSFVKYQGLPNPRQHDFPKFYFQNVVTGCVTFFNRALLEVAAPIPQAVIVHDWWFAQCAKLFGVLDYIDEPLIDYRQHGENAIGAKSHKVQTSYFKKHIYQALFRFPRHLSKAIEQVKALSALTESQEMNQAYKDCRVAEFANLRKLPLRKRLAWANIAINNPNAILETCYFKFAFFIVKWVKS